MPDPKRLDAVLLDAGGTLLRLDFEWMVDTLRDFGLATDVPALRRAEIAGRRRYDMSNGSGPAPGAKHPVLGSAGDPRAYFAGLLEAAGLPAGRLGEVERAFREKQAETIGLWGKPMEGARSAIDGLAALGLRLAVVSNSDGRAEAHLVHAGVRDGIEFVVDSQDVGMEKPDPGIFRLALERMRLAPERALYVGDLVSIDVGGARAAGLEVVLIDPFGDYAGPGIPAIAGIGQLPDWVRSRYETPQTSQPGAPPREPAHRRN